MLFGFPSYDVVWVSILWCCLVFNLIMMFGFLSYDVWVSILWCCLVFNLIMMCGFLDAVASEFTCNKWDRKRVYMAIYIYVQCNMEPGANDLHSAVGISSLLFWTVGSCSCQPSNSTVQSVPCQNSNTQETRQCRRVNHDQNQKALSLFCAEMRRIAFSGLAIMRHLTDRDSTKLTLGSDSDAHSAED
jgi:hypothetical protein